eukprot:TRINITY_DN8119_c0_g1_i1.p1 TRINITY_DN8119_c0_g1~~TRINITY_DN8119_c0_g1_i1.p1  ORF type:complete len:166 (-),score=43.99 TRINITY_DN8119_c0_g1_i1:65-562(-)
MAMKTEKCHFSGFRIYPGHGKKFIRVDCRSFTFLDAKCEATALNKVNPRKVKWTQIYRRVHKKDRTTTEVKKRRATKIVRVQRDIVGATRNEIRAKRKQAPALREAAKAEALKEVKARQEKRKAGATATKTAAAKTAAPAKTKAPAQKGGAPAGAKSSGKGKGGR